MKTIRLTDDTNIKEPTGKMVCDCGWEEKAYLIETRARAIFHIRTRHTQGQIKYKGKVTKVAPL